MSQTPPIPFWRRTPPAIFPPILGLFGLGLAWRRAETGLGLEPMLGQLILGAVTILYLGALCAYGAKVLARPGVLADEMRVLPGRAGLSAMGMAGLALSLAVLPLAPGAAAAILSLALAVHLALAALYIRALTRAPEDQRRVTPAWHLAFVGFIVGVPTAAGLGWTGLGQTIFVATLVATLAIYAVSLGQLLRQGPPPPLRPLLAIHLAPPSVFGSAALALGWSGAAWVAGALALAILAALLLRLRFILAAGFTPLWGAFTFPLAAFAGLTLGLAETGGPAVTVLGAVALTVATLAVPAIAVRVMRAWARGKLAEQTNAAIA